MAILSKAGITSGSLIEASHVTQIIDALTSSGSVIDILVTGSFRVAGTTQLGILGTSTQSPLVFNPDTSGQSVFYVKNPNGTLTIGTGANPYAGSDYITLSPLGLLSLNGNLSTTNAYVTSNLGVGTTNPLTRLAVSNNGSQSIEMDYSAPLNANYIQSYDRVANKNVDLVYYMASGVTGSHRFYTNNSQRMVIDPSGYVGIGTATPSSTLEVAGGTILKGNTIVSGSNLTISNSYPRLFLTDTDSDSDYSLINDNGGFVVYDDTNTSPRIYITPSGSIGLNKFSPNAPLDVNGNALISGSITVTSAVTSTNLTIDSNTVLSGSTTLFGNAGLLDIKGTDHAYIEWYPDNTTRKSYFGFASSGSTNLILENENTNGNISLITNNGYIGINKYTPAASLDVNGNALITGSLFVSSSISASGDIISSAGLSTRNGIVNLGGTFSTRNAAITSTATELQILRSGSFPIIFSNGATTTERMRITPVGEVYIAGTTDQGAYNLQVNGTGVWGAGAYVNGSDSRIKENIVSLESGLDIVTKLNPVTYRYKRTWSKDQSIQPGFIAQELQEALKDKNYVDGVVQNNSQYMSVAYQNLIPILTKAIQEQQAQIETLKLQVASLISGSNQ